LGTDQKRWRGENRATRGKGFVGTHPVLAKNLSTDVTLCYLAMEEIEEMENHHIGGYRWCPAIFSHPKNWIVQCCQIPKA
jgi:hypothetical protein